MSFDEHQGTVYAWRELMKIGKQAIEDGEIKPARIVFDRPAKANAPVKKVA